MEEVLSQMIGKKVDISCGPGTSVRGEIVKLKDGILYLRDEEKTASLAVDKIAVVWEVKDLESRPGFVTGRLK